MGDLCLTERSLCANHRKPSGVRRSEPAQWVALSVLRQILPKAMFDSRAVRMSLSHCVVHETFGDRTANATRINHIVAKFSKRFAVSEPPLSVETSNRPVKRSGNGTSGVEPELPLLSEWHENDTSTVRYSTINIIYRIGQNLIVRA